MNFEVLATVEFGVDKFKIYYEAAKFRNDFPVCNCLWGKGLEKAIFPDSADPGKAGEGEYRHRWRRFGKQQSREARK